MRVLVGSANPTKLAAVKSIFAKYPAVAEALIEAVPASSEVSEQPLSLEETILGAINRAKQSFSNCDLSVGIEGGLMEVPYSKTGLMNVCACALYDGEIPHLGLSSAFEHPTAVIELVRKQCVDVSAAYRLAGLTTEDKIGINGGAIGLLTDQRLPRKEYVEQAIINALIHLEKRALFQ